MTPQTEDPSFPGQLQTRHPDRAPTLSPLQAFHSEQHYAETGTPHHIQELILPQYTSIPTTYPESSQRTPNQKEPYPATYALRRDGGLPPDLGRLPTGTRLPTLQQVYIPTTSGRDTIYPYHGSLDQRLHQAALHYRPEQPYPESDGSLTSSVSPASGTQIQSLPQSAELEARYHSPDAFDTTLLLSLRDSGDTPNDPPYTTQGSTATPQSSSAPSIPMCNNTSWSHASLDRTMEPQSKPQRVQRKASKRPSRMTPDSDSSTSLGLPGSYAASPAVKTIQSSSSTTSSAPLAKKKSKMHECEICQKKFPRPSGLQIHMNTHNNVKPFPCGFPGCSRSFTVRSNATRHLRTHGIYPTPTESQTTPYVVGFSTPNVMPPSSATHEMTKVPIKLRWMPPSLASRSNADKLNSLSDAESGSDDVSETEEWRSALPIPLNAVVPSADPNDPDFFEERNSYLDAKPFPYHHTQFSVLPGPSMANSRTFSVE